VKLTFNAAKCRWLLSLAVLMVARIMPLEGQGPTTGAITGTVTDASGAVLADAIVKLASPALLTPQSTITSQQGTYRFPSIPPGTYSVTVEVAGFSKATREGIEITAGFTGAVDVQMALAGQVQTVAVTAEGPVLDTENTQTQDLFQAAQLQELPTSRDMWSLMGIGAGFTLKTFDVGGAAMGTQISYSTYGMTGQQRVQMDGINMTEGTSATSAYTDYNAFEEVQMGTSAVDAAMPSPGAQVNFVVKSGGNQFHGDFYQDYENGDFQGHNINLTQLDQGAGVGTRVTSYHDTNGTFGGPIIKNKLWFFAAARYQYIATTITGFPVQDPGTGPAFYTALSNATYKLSYQLNPKNKISQMTNFERKQQPYRNAANNQYQDAVYDEDLLEWIVDLDWSSTLSPNAFLNVRVGDWGYNWVDGAYGPGLNGNTLAPRQTETQTGNVAGSFDANAYFRRRSQIMPTLSYSTNFLGVNHFVNFGYLYEKEDYAFTQQSYYGAYSLTYDSAVGAPDFTTPYEVTLYNTPSQTHDFVHHQGAYIQDKVKVTKRLTLNLGVRWDYYNDFEPQQSVNPSAAPWDSFFYAGAALPNGYSIPATAPNYTFAGHNHLLRYPLSFAPRLGFAYDLFGNGRTTLKGSWGRYYENPGIDITSANVNPIRTLSYTFKWNAPTGATVFLPSQLGAYVSSSGSSVTPIAPNIRDPYMDDFNGTVEHEVAHGLVVRGTFVYRKLDHTWVAVQQNLVTALYSNPVTKTYVNPAGTTESVTVFDYPTSLTIPTSYSIEETPNWNNQFYRNIEFAVMKRMSGKFSLQGNYLGTWSDYLITPTATQPNILQYNWASVFNANVRVSGTYKAPWGVTITPIYRFQLGAPLQQVVPITGLRQGTLTLPLDSLGSYRTNNISLFDTRFEKYLTFKEKYKVGLFLDLFNIFNSNADQTQDNTIGTKSAVVNGQTISYQRFLSAETITPPRIFRLGAKFAF
jgi:Carboxypeptidase regulatory-like domain/TonB dependent receptor